MFAFFESKLRPTAVEPEPPAPPALDTPAALVRFYWHFVRQARGLVAALFCAGLLVAALDTTVPVFIGRVVALVSRTARRPRCCTTPGRSSPDGRGAAGAAPGRGVLLQALITNQALARAWPT